MWPYWMMFAVPAAAALMQPTTPWAQMSTKSSRIRLEWAALILLWTVVIGLRHEVGGDWANYLEHQFDIHQDGFLEVFARSDPGYWLIAWIASQSDLGIYLANLTLAAVFSTGLVLFCRAQPRPWLALAVAVPYLVIVVGMGYTRQGVALSLAMIGLVALERKRTLAFVIWIALGALFHRSAIVLIPLGIIATPRNRLWSAIWIGLTALALYEVILRESIETLQINYMEAEYQSEGALVRVLMNVLPAVILLVARKRFQWAPAERNLWTMMALLAVASAAWLSFSESSTAVDRLALYLIPLQLYVFTRLPDVASQRPAAKRAWVMAVLAYYMVVQLVWLFFATHAEFWLPYRLYPFANS